MNENTSVSSKPDINVAVPERVASVAIGSALFANLIRKGSLNIPMLASSMYLLYRGITGNCPAYSLMKKPKLADPVKNINVRTSVIVGRPRNEVYEFWRNVENLPLFMSHLQSVKAIDDKTSHWKAKIPAGGSIEWYAEIVKDERNRLIGWNSLAGATVVNAGKVEFEDVTGGATKVSIVITYRAPLGAIGQSLSRLLNPAFRKMVTSDINSFKDYLEKITISERNLL